MGWRAVMVVSSEECKTDDRGCNINKGKERKREFINNERAQDQSDGNYIVMNSRTISCLSKIQHIILHTVPIHKVSVLVLCYDVRSTWTVRSARVISRGGITRWWCWWREASVSRPSRPSSRTSPTSSKPPGDSSRRRRWGTDGQPTINQ